MRTAGITALAMLAGYCAGHVLGAYGDAGVSWITGGALMLIGALIGGAVQEDGS